MASIDSTAEPRADASAAPPKRRGPLSLALGCALVLIAAYATTFALFLFVPEGNDYVRIAIDKHERLVSAPGRRIVLVGGSNLAYGVDSTLLEARTGCTPVNMGLNGYLGVRYMQEEVRPHVRAGDIVVLSFEYDNFYKTVDGSPDSLLVVVKTNPATLSALTPTQLIDMAARVPFIAQQKMLRVAEDAVGVLRRGARGPDAVDNSRPIKAFETYSAFNRYGDIVSHLGVVWPREGRERGVNMSALPVDRNVVALMDDFTRDMEARGVSVVYSYSPVQRDFFEQHRAAFDDLGRRMEAAPRLLVPRSPQGFVFGEDRFFDTVYHLNGEGRAIRTERLIEDLQATLGARADCRATQGNDE